MMTAKPAWRVLSVLLAFVAGIYFVGFVAKNIQDLPQISWGLWTWLLLGMSILSWVGIVMIGSFIWRSLLADINQRLDWHTCLAIYGVAQLAKYLPGNIGQHVGRAILAKQAGIPVAVTLHTMLIEVALGIGIASGIALVGLSLIDWIQVSPALLVLLISATMLSPWIFLKIVRSFFPGLAARMGGGVDIESLRLRTLAIASLLYLATFMIVGFMMGLHATFLFGAHGKHFLTLTVAFAWSWLAGYITPGAPAGLGIREAVLVSTLTPLFGAGIAVGLTIVLRVATTLGDGLAFLIAVSVMRFKKGNNSAGP